VGPEDHVLDVATGTGAVAAELVLQHRCRVTGIDQSPPMLAAAAARLDELGLSQRVSLVEAEAEALPFPDASFDGLTVSYLLRYVADPGATLRELVRVVRPGSSRAWSSACLRCARPAPRGVSTRAPSCRRPAWRWAGGPGGAPGASCTTASPTSTTATRSPRCSTSTGRPGSTRCACGA
jgi:ubiquinone/menaquinone biosynthesis C-methylase UbiE